MVDQGSELWCETVLIHAVRKRAMGFSNVKSITLELVDKVHIVDLQLA